ncbi:MAG: outer membrane protein assembly factor BamD [Gammaproteobacteria bacterium]|nr:MAG: outer membrane protein assembly factor BamD [Gammaproteobacteria bacterium]
MKDYTFTPQRSIWQVLLMLILIASISGCSSLWPFGKDDEEKDSEIAADESAAKIYNAANKALVNREIDVAVEQYQLLETRYPFGRYAQQGLLELAYAYHAANKPDRALATINRFIKLNPQHPSIDYAYYMKGLTTFDKGKSLIHVIVKRDPSNNDPTYVREAFDIFKLLIEKYPDSEYAEDAKYRMIYLRNELAEYELKVAKFYMQRGAYVASANRAKYIMENYQGAEIMPEAVYILEQAYLALELNDLAYDTHRVYAQNYQTGKDGVIDEKFANKSCAESLWGKALEKLRLRTYYCN